MPLWVRRDQLQADLLDQARRRWDTLLQPAREQFARLQQLEQTQAAWRQRMQPVYDSLAALNQQTPGTDLMQGIQGIGGVGDTLGRAGAGLQDLNRQQPGTGLLEQMQPQVTRAGQDLDALGQRGSMLITPLADIGRRALGTLGQAGQVAGAVGEFNPVEAGSRAGLATRQGLSELGPTPAGQYLQQPLAGVRKAYTDTGAQVERTRREAQQATRPLLGETGSQVAGLGAAGLSALPVFAGELGAQSARRAFGGTPLEEPMVGLTRGLGQASGVGFGVGGVEQGMGLLGRGLAGAGLVGGTAAGLSQGQPFPEALGTGAQVAGMAQPVAGVLEAGARVAQGVPRVARALGQAVTEETSPLGRLGVLFGNPPEVARGPGGPRDVQGAITQEFRRFPATAEDISQPRRPGRRQFLEGDIDVLGRPRGPGETINPDTGYIAGSPEDRFALLNRGRDASVEEWQQAGMGLPGDPTGAAGGQGLPRTFSARIPNGARNIVPDLTNGVVTFERPVVANKRLTGYRSDAVPVTNTEGLTASGIWKPRAETPLEYQRAVLARSLDRRDFYPHFGSYFMDDLSRGNDGLFMELNAIFGATASNASPETNLNRALGVMAAGRSFARQHGGLAPATVEELRPLVRDIGGKKGPFFVGGITDADLQKVIEIWRDGTADIGSGFKTPVFSENIEAGAYHYFSPFDVPDTHMLRGLGYTQLGTGPATTSSANSNPRAIALVHAMVRQLSDEFGLSPNQVQSALWYGYKNELAPLNRAQIMKATKAGVPLTGVDPWPTVTLQHDVTLPSGEVVKAGTQTKQGTLEATIEATRGMRAKWEREMQLAGYGALTPQAETASLTYNGKRLDVPKRVQAVRGEPRSYLQINPQASERARFAAEQRGPIAAVPGAEEALQRLGYDAGNERLEALWRDGIQHRAVPEPRPLAGQPTVRVLLPGGSVDTARYAAARLGQELGTPEVAILWPTRPGTGTTVFAFEHPGALEGQTWAANPDVAPWAARLLEPGSGGSLSADGRTLFFADWNREGQGFTDRLFRQLTEAGMSPQEIRRYGRRTTNLGAERIAAEQYPDLIQRGTLVAPGTPVRRSPPAGFAGTSERATTPGGFPGAPEPRTTAFRAGMGEPFSPAGVGERGEAVPGGLPGAPGVGPGGAPGVAPGVPPSPGAAGIVAGPGRGGLQGALEAAAGGPLTGAERAAGVATGGLMGGQQFKQSQEEGEPLPQSLGRGALGFALGAGAGPSALRLGGQLGRIGGRTLGILKAQGLAEDDLVALQRLGVIFGPHGEPLPRTPRTPGTGAERGRRPPRVPEFTPPGAPGGAGGLLGPSGQPLGAGAPPPPPAKGQAQAKAPPVTGLLGPNGQPLTHQQIQQAVQQAKQTNPGLYARLVRLSQNTLGTYGRLNLLLSPLTHARNILANTVAVPWQIAEAGVAPAFEPLARAGGKTPDARYWQEAPMLTKGLFSTWNQALATGLDVLQHGQHGQTTAPAWSGVSQATSSLLQSQGAIRPGSGTRVSQALSKGFRPLEAADAFFTTLNEGMELYRQAYRQARRVPGLTPGGPAFDRYVQNLTQSPTKGMIDQIVRAGEYQTYRQDLDGLGKALAGFSDVPILGQIVMPFVRTPYNAIKYDLERSPLGAFNVLAGAVDKRVSSGEMADRMARLTLGSGLFTFFAWQAAQGNITGDMPESEAERDAWQAEGKRPFSVRIPTPSGPSWVSLAYFPGLGANVAAAAAVADAARLGRQHPDRDWTQALIRGSLEFGKAVFQRPLLQSTTDLLNAMGDPAAGESLVQRTVQGAAGQVTPGSSFFRYLTQIADPFVRVSPRSYPEFLQSISPLPRGAPLSSQNLPVAQTAYGEPMFRQGRPFVGTRGSDLGTWATRAEAAFSPFRRTQEEEVPRRYRGSASDAQDAEIAAAISAVTRWENAPREWPAPTAEQRMLARRYQNRENPVYERLRKREQRRERVENLERTQGRSNR